MIIKSGAGDKKVLLKDIFVPIMITQGRLQTFDLITQHLGIEHMFDKIGNLMWKTCIAKGITPKEMAERGAVPPTRLYGDLHDIYDP